MSWLISVAPGVGLQLSTEVNSLTMNQQMQLMWLLHLLDLFFKSHGVASPLTFSGHDADYAVFDIQGFPQPSPQSSMIEQQGFTTIEGQKVYHSYYPVGSPYYHGTTPDGILQICMDKKYFLLVNWLCGAWVLADIGPMGCTRAPQGGCPKFPPMWWMGAAR